MLKTTAGLVENARPVSTGEDMKEKVKIEITRNTVCDGEDVFVGDKITVVKDEARKLIRMGKAVPAEAQTKTKAKK